MQVLDSRFVAVEADFRAKRNAISKAGLLLSIDLEPRWLRDQFRPNMEELSQHGCLRASAWLLRHFDADEGEKPEAVRARKLALYRQIFDGHAGADWLDSTEIDVIHALVTDAPLLGRRSIRELADALFDANPGRMERRAKALRAIERSILAGEESDAQRRAEAANVWRSAVEAYAGTPLAEYAADEVWRLEHFWIGDQAPRFVAVDVDGNELLLEDFRGKVVVVAFFKLGERSDLAWVSRLRSLAEKNETEPFVVLGVETGTSEAVFRRLWEEKELRFPCAFESGSQGGRVASAWRLNETPRSYVLDGAGKLRFVGLDGAALETAVENLLQEPGVGASGIRERNQVRR